MTAAHGAAIREYIDAREIVTAAGTGEMTIQRINGEPFIQHADPSILVTIELVDHADEHYIHYADGTLTFNASNGTVRYQVLGASGPTYRSHADDEWRHAPVVCQRIDP